MCRLFLLTALLAGMIVGVTTADAHKWRHDGESSYEGLRLVAVPAHRHPGRWRMTPWHYHPQGRCLPPWCPPAYHRHLEFLPAFRALPLQAVLERLARLDYRSFGRVFLNGSNYSIEARNRYGQVVRLIVNAGNGQIRRILQ